MSFYIFLGTSARYRRQVKHFFVKKCRRTLKLLCSPNRNAVHPSTGAISNVMSVDDD